MVRSSRSKVPRKEQIVNAARKLVIKYGSENVTVRRIAEEVGFSEAAIYRHFKSKKDILYLLVEIIESNLISDLELQGHTKGGRLENILINHLSDLEMKKGISFQVIAEIISLGDKRLNRRIYETIEKYIAKLKEVLKDEIAEGELRSDIDVDAAAIILFSVAQGLSNIWTLSNYKFKPREKFDPLLHILRKGLT
jgi:AcrR family transcriptional regulator